MKFKEAKLENPKLLPSYKLVSVLNQNKELEETLSALQDKMVEFYFFLNS